jgi:hypothetical protein
MSGLLSPWEIQFLKSGKGKERNVNDTPFNK